MAAVSIRKLAVKFGDLTVLNTLDLEIDPGEFIVLLGPSGCGKSTLLNSIAGLLDISEGQIWIGDKNVTWEEPSDRGIGMVFQSYALYPRMTVEGNLSFGLKMARTPKAEVEKRVKMAASLLQIEPLMKRRPSELSGGQRQRVAIGRALVRDVDVFLFDEPLSNLDAALRTDLRVELKRLHKELGNSTMIYVTHDQIEALTLADRIAVMHGGVIQQLADPKTIYHKPANKFVAGFVGSPKMNFFDGKIESDAGEPVFIADGLRQPLNAYQFASDVQPGMPVELGIRPEHIRIDSAGTSPATVDLVEPMGAETLLWCTLGGKTVGMRLDGETDIAADQKLDVSLVQDRLNLFSPDSGLRL